MNLKHEKLLEQRDVVQKAHEKHMEELQKFHKMEYDYLRENYVKWNEENMTLLQQD